MEEKQLSELITKKLESINYDLVSLKVSRNGGSLSVGIVVDRVAPINMDDIVEVTNVLSGYFDEIDPFDAAYNLDISSLGAEKPLKVENLSDYVSSYINVHVNNPIDGENIFEGILKEVNNNSILVTRRIKTRSKDVEVMKSNILKIRLAIKF